MKKLVLLLSSVMIMACTSQQATNTTDNGHDSITASGLDSVSLDGRNDSIQIQNVKDSITADSSFKTKRPPVKAGELLFPEVKVKGIYVTGPTAGTRRMKEMVSLLTETEMNTMVLDIKNDGGNITYNIDYDKAREVGACIRYVKDMPALLKELHEKGIYVIGRIVCFKDPYLAKHDSSLALVNADGSPVTDGKGLPWVNPYKQEVWDYLCSLAEQASEDGFDEIQFDYVRFPIVGSKVPRYGVDLENYSREQCLAEFFSYVQKRLHAKNIVYGADLFGTVIGSEKDRDLTGQDYAKLGTLADNVCPMIYPSHYGKKTFGIPVPDADPYHTIYRALMLSKEQLNDSTGMSKSRVRPWLQCFTAPWVSGHITYGAKQLKEQIKAVYDAGYEEWILWNASNRYDYVKSALSTDKKVVDKTSVGEVEKKDLLTADSIFVVQ